MLFLAAIWALTAFVAAFFAGGLAVATIDEHLKGLSADWFGTVVAEAALLMVTGCFCIAAAYAVSWN